MIFMCIYEYMNIEYNMLTFNYNILIIRVAYGEVGKEDLKYCSDSNYYELILW